MSIHICSQTDYTELDFHPRRHSPTSGTNLVQQPQSRHSSSIESKNSSLDPALRERTIAKLDSEVRRNQRRIAQLNYRNAQLTQKIEEMGYQPSRQHQYSSVAPATTRTSSSRQRQPKPKRTQRSRTWLSISIILICIAVICGSIGFALTRLITVR